MAKGVLIGLICVVTVLPATILVFDKLIEKTSHKVILPEFTQSDRFCCKALQGCNYSILNTVSSSNLWKQSCKRILQHQ